MHILIPPHERKLLTFDEIRTQYDGKWVLITHTEFNENRKPIKGMPTVVANSAFAGSESRIYDQFFEDENNGQIWTKDFTHMAGQVASILWEA